MMVIIIIRETGNHSIHNYRQCHNGDNLLNEHAPYKRGVPWAKMALAKYF